ncbi:Na(+)-translocating NADH-quinone reductase subunit A [Celerinatantimonas sp. MCCC 1A17872]|uniref:Na(+)-translocating NADH-quinone reductase subunit A n=1 Tax=Celerinatantimonas sp. MCCC 1A17872 TaxID=3177514 RepID=UPI0038CBBDAF
MISIKKGLDVPITGAPKQQITDKVSCAHVAVLGEEYVGMRPTMKVKVGDQVIQGDVLFEDKKNPGIIFTAPASGEIVAINRGARRVLQSVVIKKNEQPGKDFGAITMDQLESISRQQIVDKLVQSGQWSAFKSRPFSHIPAIDAKPAAIFVTAMDTNPLAADAKPIIERNAKAYTDGLLILSKLTEGEVFVCKGEQSLPSAKAGNIREETFVGPHPAGLAGTHIHFLKPVSLARRVWTINYQDVIAFGKLFTTGKIDAERVISLAGPEVKEPRLVITELGAALDEICEGELKSEDGPLRIISGSVLCGMTAEGPHAYLGRYHHQVSVLKEGIDKEFLGWAVPGSNKFSLARVFSSHLNRAKKFAMTTTTGGSERAMVPIGLYERVMPLDILATMLLRDLLSGDTDSAQQLGCLELEEEDLALCSFVCPGKYEYGPVLRQCLAKIEAEG